MNQDKLTEFFATHPTINEVYSALGRLFIEKDKAQQFLAGVSGKAVTTYTREGVQHANKSDELFHEMLAQENLINEKQLAYEKAPSNEKQQAMSEWKAAQDKLLQMQHAHKKQLIEEKKDAAKTAGSAKPKADSATTVVVTDVEALKKKIDSKGKEIATTTVKRDKAKGAEKTKLTNRLKTLNKEWEELNALLPEAPVEEEVNEPVMIDHVVTEEDLVNNPDLGAAVGETIQIPQPIEEEKPQ